MGGRVTLPGWPPGLRGPVFGVDWSTVAWGDPAMVWIDLAHGIRARPDASSGTAWVPLLAELRLQGGQPQIPRRLRSLYPPGSAQHWRLQQGAVGAYWVAPRDIAALMADPDVVALSASRFRRAAGTPGPSRDVPPAGSGRHLPPVVAVIDDFCAFAHARLRRRQQPGHTRLLGLWDQGGTVAGRGGIADWRCPADMGYGAELDRSALDALLAACTVQGNVQEQRCYTLADWPGAGQPLRRSSHGQAVLDLAAGEPAPVPPQAGQLPGGPDADLLFVRLPLGTVRDTSGASLGPQVIDALRYIEHRTRGRRVVVVLPYGTHAGPHDGHSLLERAFASVLQQQGPASAWPGLHLVVPAGNAFEARCHAQATVGAGREVTLHWQVLPDDPTDSLAQLWFDGPGPVEVTLHPPQGGTVLRLVGPGVASDASADLRTPASRALIAMPKGVDGGPHAGHMVMAALGPTRALFGAPWRSVPHGVWTVVVRNGSTQPLGMHAWVERDDTAFGQPPGGRQSHWLTCPGGVPVSEPFTFNGLACLEADRFHVAGGGFLHADHLAHYTASGPNRGGGRAQGPDWVLPSEESPVLHGLPTGGLTTATWIRMDGTSVAAPLLARLLAQGVDPAQWPRWRQHGSTEVARGARRQLKW
jgi:hypothetical protein